MKRLAERDCRGGQGQVQARFVGPCLLRVVFDALMPGSVIAGRRIVEFRSFDK